MKVFCFFLLHCCGSKCRILVRVELGGCICVCVWVFFFFFNLFTEPFCCSCSLLAWRREAFHEVGFFFFFILLLGLGFEFKIGYSCKKNLYFWSQFYILEADYSLVVTERSYGRRANFYLPPLLKRNWMEFLGEEKS